MTSAEETVQKSTLKSKKKPAPKQTAVSAVRRRSEELFRGQTSDIVRLMLLASAGLSAVFDEPKTAAAAMVLITAEAAAGLIRESRCVSASERISKAAEPRVERRIDGGTETVPASDLREGDIFEISEGGIFPRDSIIIEQQELVCDESALTGNVSPAEKTAYAGEEIKDRLGLRYIGYSGTVVVGGSAVCKAAGNGSEAFRREDEPRERPSSLVTDSRRRAEAIFAGVCSVSGAVIAAAGMIRGAGVTEPLSLGLAATAVCIPERLAAAAELSSTRIRRLLFGKGIIVRDTAALERLGDTELILADLRGTVADSRRSVRKLYIPADGSDGYDYSEVTGRLTFDRGEDGYMAWENSALGETMICAAVCCKARRSRKGGTPRNRRSFYEGDSDDAALLALCSACGIDRELLLLNKLSERQDDPAERCVSVTCRVLGGELRIYTKGDPEALFPLCGGVYGTDDPAALRNAARRASQLAEEGLGVTAFCETTGGQTLLLGLAGLWAPIPAQTSEAIRSMRRMGVRTMMFTEDERQTAKAAAVSAGIMTEGRRCCTGAELDAMTDEQAEAVSGAVAVFARSGARHKARIAALAEDMRLCCAAAVSTREEAAVLSEKQTLIFACENSPECVKQKAEVILPRCGLEELSGAVRCGRALYGALRGRACLGIELAAAVMIMLLTAAVTGMPTPLLPVQLLLAALITEPAAAVSLTMLPASGRMSAAHPSKDGCFVGRRLLSAHFVRGLLTAFSMLGCFTMLLRTGSLAEARTGTAAAMTLTRLLSVVRLCGSDKLPARAAAAVVITAGLAAAAVTVPVIAGIFAFVPLSAAELMLVLAAAVLPSLAAAAARAFQRRRI